MTVNQRENRFAKGRIVFLQWVVVVCTVALAVGFFRLQIYQSEYYSGLAEKNHLKSIPVPAPRGRIMDRYNRVLVDNSPSYNIMAQWEFLKSLEEHAVPIANGLGLEPKQLIRDIQSSRKRAPYRPLVIQENVSRQNIAFVESHRVEFPELDLVSVQSRSYMPDNFGASLFGYVGEISDADLDNVDLALAEPGALVGKSGIERQYDDILRGTDGERRVIVNSRGAEKGVLDEKPPVSGHSLHLTIDYDLQVIAEENFKGDDGALVALDPRTGEVLAMVSRPSFDPNLFAKGISRANWSALVNDPGNPLLNRAVQAQLAPGSVYKILMATAGLESGTVTPSTMFYCPGGGTFYGRYFHCWEKKGHGGVDIHRAIVQSCDVFFYSLGRDMGVDKISEYSAKFGIGQKTGIDLPVEETGTLPSAVWKEKMFHEKWYAGETISLAIGQGALTLTPLQVAYSVGGVTSDGNFRRPHLVSWKDLNAMGRPLPDPIERHVDLKEETVKTVTDGMYGVVNEGGTGGRARIVGVDVAGKTGSSQVASLDLAKSNRGAFKDNAWFIGIAPRRNPEIAVAVLMVGGEHGFLAAPIAKAVIQAYYDKKKGIQPKFAGKPEGGENPEPAAEIADSATPKPQG